MKAVFTILIALFSLLFSFEIRSQPAQTDSSKNFIRLSGLAPMVVLEHSFSPIFSINGGFGVGYYIRRRNYYDYQSRRESVFVVESASIDYPLFRLNYPSTVETIHQVDYKPDRTGEPVHVLKPFLDLEARIYVNKKLREKKGKSIENNSANYINIAGSYYFDDLKFYRLYYGLQRNMERFWIDWSAGLGYSSGEFESGVFIQGSLKLGLRLYKF